MININTDSGQFPIPYEPMLSHWNACIKWGFENPKSWRIILHEVTDCPIQELNQISDDVIEILFGHFVQRFNEVEEIRPDFSGFNFGQFVDADVMLSLGIEKWMMQIWYLISGKEDAPYKEAWPQIIKLYEWRKSVYREYDEFFGLSEVEKAKERGVEIEEKETTLSSLQTSWYTVIQQVAGEDFTKQDWVTDQPYKKVLNWLTWKKWRDEQLELEMIRKR